MKHTKITILVMGIALLLPMGMKAEQLTIQQCRDLALKNNKEKQSAQLSTKAAEFNKKSVWAQFFPSLSLMGYGLYDTGKGGFSYDISGMKGGLASAVTAGVMGGALSMPQAMWIQQLGAQLPDQVNVIDYKVDFVYGGSLVLKQPLYMGGKIRAGYRMSDLAVNLYREGERLTEAQVIQSADEAYAKVVNAQELAQVALRYKEVLQELDANVQSAIRHGMKIDNDRMKVQVKLNEVELQLRRAENGIRLAKMNLCHVIGQPLTADIDVSGDYPAVDDAMQLQTSDVSARPEYAMLDYQTKIAEQQVRMTRSEMMPQLALLAKYGYTHGLEVNGHPLLDDWNFAGGVTLNVPLFHFGEHINKVKAAKAKLEQAQIEQNNKAEMMLLELTRAANNLDEARMEVTLAESSLLQAEQNMKIAGQQYQAGLETLSDYLESQALWQKAYESKVNSHFQVYLASVDYLRAAGLLVQ